MCTYEYNVYSHIYIYTYIYTAHPPGLRPRCAADPARCAGGEYAGGVQLLRTYASADFCLQPRAPLRHSFVRRRRRPATCEPMACVHCNLRTHGRCARFIRRRCPAPCTHVACVHSSRVACSLPPHAACSHGQPAAPCSRPPQTRPERPGRSLYYKRSQPRLHTVAAYIAHGCSLCYIRLQAWRHGDAARNIRRPRRSGRTLKSARPAALPACLPPACHLPATRLPPACHLPATCLPPACHPPATCL